MVLVTAAVIVAVVGSVGVVVVGNRFRYADVGRRCLGYLVALVRSNVGLTVLEQQWLLLCQAYLHVQGSKDYQTYAQYIH